MFALNLFTFRGLGVLAAMLASIASRAEVAAEMVIADGVEWTEMYVPYANDEMFIPFDNDENITDAEKVYDIDDPQRQHLHVFQNPSEEPSPVFFFAHGLNGVGWMESGLSHIANAGFSIIIWESVTTVDSSYSVKACWHDFSLVWAWYKANAEWYNFDPESAVIGGQSRGTVCSWKLAYSGKPEVKGIFMLDALPDPAWKETDIWVNVIDDESPPAHLVYGQECPKPIQQDCVTNPNKGDMHNPKNGQAIVNEYIENGIGSKIKLTDGLYNKGIGNYDLFPEFVASLSPPLGRPLGSSTAGLDSSSTVFGGGDASFTAATSSSSGAAAGSSHDSSWPSMGDSSTSSGEESSSVTTADSVFAAAISEDNFFFYLCIASAFVVCTVFGYCFYYKRKQAKLNRNQKVIVEHSFGPDADEFTSRLEYA